MNLGRAQRAIHGQLRHQFRENACVVRALDQRELPTIFALEHEVDRSARCLRRDDRAQMRQLRQSIRVLKVHRRHLRDKPRNHALGGVAKAAGKFIDDASAVGRGIDRRRGWGNSHFVYVPSVVK